MTTASALIAETRRHLESYQRTPMNRLAAGVDADDTTVTFEFDIAQIQAGAYVEVDLELLYVWSVDSGTKTATVDRGAAGSTAASHAAGAKATANPPFPDFAIFSALNSEIRSLSAPMNGLYRIRTVDLTASSVTGFYDLTGSTDVQEILSVQHNLPGTEQWSTVSNYALQHNAGTGFASGSALTIHDGLLPGRTVRVLYKASFDPLTDLADDVEEVSGLPESAHDIPPIGAAMRLVAPREIRRNLMNAQGDSRRAEEVPAGATSSSVRLLAQLRATRISEEASLLNMRFPDRGFTPTGPQVW